MSNVLKFKDKLDKYKILNPKYQPSADEDYYGDAGRHTYCHLLYLGKTEKPGPHRFEVRSWHLNYLTMSVGAVNWTLCAGTCSINITEDNVKDWVILEDDPDRINILYGR